jgi:hypothetical protein
MISIKRFSCTSILVMVMVCASAMLYAHPALGMYDWETVSKSIKATGSGMTAVTEGNPGTVMDDIVIDTALLPSDVLSFEASPASSGVLLQWSIAAEQDNNNFRIEHSHDGSSFTVIVSLAEKNIAEGRANYSYIDLNPSDGDNYYRLLQYDVDGKVEDLGMKRVLIKSLNSAYIYPNPVTSNRVTIYLGHSITRPVLYQVADMNGSVVQKGILTNSVQTIGVDGLANGLYILRLNTGEIIKLDKK